MIFFVFGPLWFVVLMLVLFAYPKQIVAAILSLLGITAVFIVVVVVAMLLTSVITGVDQFADKETQSQQILTKAMKSTGDVSIKLKNPRVNSGTEGFGYCKIVRKSGKIMVDYLDSLGRSSELHVIKDKSFNQVVDDFYAQGWNVDE